MKDSIHHVRSRSKPYNKKLLHPPKKAGATLHAYFPITGTSLQRPLFRCPQGGVVQPRSQCPLLLGRRGHGCRVGEDSGNEICSGVVERFNSLATKRRPNVNDVKNNLNIIGHFGGKSVEAF